MPDESNKSRELEQLRRRVAQLEAELERQRGAGESWQDGERPLRVALDQLPVVMWTTDAQLRFTWSLGAGLARLGLSPGEMTGRSLFEYFQTDDADFPPIAQHRRALAGRSVWFDQRWQDNSYRVYLEPLHGKGGDIDGVVGVALDVTEQVRAEDALWQKEEGYRTIFESTADGLVVMRLDGGIVEANPAFCEMLGYTCEEMPRLAPEDWVYGDDLPLFAEMLEAVGHQRPFQCTARDRRRDGSLIEVDVRAVPIVFHGRPHALGIVRDITEQRRMHRELRLARDELEKRVEERTADLARANRLLSQKVAEGEEVTRRLRQSEDRFRIIAETLPVSVVISRVSDGLVLYANRRLGETFRTPHQELIGELTPDYYRNVEDRERMREEFQRAGQVRDMEIEFVRRDGSHLWLSCSVQPLVYDNQECILAGLIDVTQRKRAEQSLRAERRRLLRLIDLQERDRQLIAYEIHDGVVQDMTAAHMFLDASSYTVSDNLEQTRENLDNAQSLLKGSIDEARRLINGLRPSVLEEQGVVAALRDFIGEFRRNSGIDVVFQAEVKFERLAPTLESAIYRIVQEALNNVWRHSQSPTAKVLLQQPNEHVEIRVRDQGVGFDPRHVRKKRYGLMGVRERAKLLGGAASVRSAPGEGAEIFVSLPIDDSLLPTDDWPGGEEETP